MSCRRNSHHGDFVTIALERFGNGRQKAALNRSDCFGYAVAKAANAPILFIGDDFSRTDLLAAGSVAQRRNSGTGSNCATERPAIRQHFGAQFVVRNLNWSQSWHELASVWWMSV